MRSWPRWHHKQLSLRKKRAEASHSLALFFVLKGRAGTMHAYTKPGNQKKPGSTAPATRSSWAILDPAPWTYQHNERPRKDQCRSSCCSASFREEFFSETRSAEGSNLPHNLSP